MYAFRREVLKFLPERGNIEEAAFPMLAERGRLRGVTYRDVFWRSIDSVKDLEEVDKFFRENS